jgi:hypothetical protein
MAMSIVLVAGLSSVQALTVMNRKAATMRTTNNARAIVQRNIDTALGVPFAAGGTVPAILAIGTGPYDDDGDGSATVPVVVARNGTSRVVNGRVLRTVTAESTTPDIRRVTFTVGWPYRGGSLTATLPYEMSMTTLRTTD